MIAVAPRMKSPPRGSGITSQAWAVIGAETVPADVTLELQRSQDRLHAFKMLRGWSHFPPELWGWFLSEMRVVHISNYSGSVMNAWALSCRFYLHTFPTRSVWMSSSAGWQTLWVLLPWEQQLLWTQTGGAELERWSHGVYQRFAVLLSDSVAESRETGEIRAESYSRGKKLEHLPR